MVDKKAYNKKWASENRDKMNAACTRFRKAHPEYDAEWRKSHPELIRATNAKYRKDNHEKVKAAKDKWKKAHPGKEMECSANWRKKHPERIKANSVRWYKENTEKIRENKSTYYKSHREEAKAYADKWQKTEKGKECGRRRYSKRKQFGFVPLNKPFVGAVEHHVDKERVIYIPEKLHISIPHSVTKNRNMERINEAAFNWLKAEKLQIPEGQ